MPHDREAAVFLHPTCARNLAAIIALEHRTGMVAMVRPGDPAPRLERLPARIEYRAGPYVFSIACRRAAHGWIDDAPLSPDGDAPLGPGAA